jgi:hypothetical protein
MKHTVKYYLFCALLTILSINCTGNPDKEKNREITEDSIPVSKFSADVPTQSERSKENPDLSKWLGKYTLTINSGAEDWRNERYITLSVIGSDSILFHAEGYQVAQEYKLKLINTENNSLSLFYDHTIDDCEIGGGTATLKKTKDFGTITITGDEYTWSCPYIDLWRFDNGETEIYRLEKSDLKD